MWPNEKRENWTFFSGQRDVVMVPEVVMVVTIVLIEKLRAGLIRTHDVEVVVFEKGTT